MLIPRNILIADDHDLIRSGLSDIIKTIADDIHIILSTNGAETLTALTDNKIEMAILDIDLPDQSGMDIAQIVKDRNLANSIVIFTGVENPTFAHKALLEIGVDAFILKSASINQTISTISAILSGEDVKSEQIKNLPPISTKIFSRQKHHDAPELSNREREILNLIINGYTSSQISDQLLISGNTVRKHRENINRKFGVSSPSELIVAALNFQTI